MILMGMDDDKYVNTNLIFGNNADPTDGDYKTINGSVDQLFTRTTKL